VAQVTEEKTMNKQLLETMAKALVSMLIARLSPSMLKVALGSGLAWLKAFIIASEPKWDDRFILPIIENMEDAFLGDDVEDEGVDGEPV
jgi:hypothetical protein